jgi:YbbR domain-containing protein
MAEKWPVKIISVAAALIIAVFYRMNTLETRTFLAPLQVETNGMLIPVSSLEDTVKISLRGETNSIYPILEEDIEAFIDLNRYSNEGTYRIPVQIRKKGSALGVVPLEISVLPIEISLLLEKKIRKDIPVFPEFQGAVASGYEIISRSINPESLTVEGPRSSVETQHEFNTEIINLEGRNESFSVLVNIINNNQLITVYGDRMIEYSGVIRKIEIVPPPVSLPQIYELSEIPESEESSELIKTEGGDSEE